MRNCAGGALLCSPAMSTRSRIWLSCLFPVLVGCTSTSPSAEDSDPTNGLTTTGASSTETSGNSSEETSDGSKLDLPGEFDLPSAETGEECAADTIEPELTSVPVDIILVIDTSFSMGDAIAAVQTSINVDFAQILMDSGVDYRLVVLGAQTDTQVPICISAPLSGTDCNPPPAVPAINDTYKHYDAETGSGAFLNSILNWHSMPDKHGLAPGGYQDFLRPEASKVILGMTDGASASGDPAAGDTFDSALLSLIPASFGIEGDRQYVFHLVVDMPANMPPTEPWLADDPIAGLGGSLQQVAILSGGWRFPLSETGSFPVLFQEIASDVVESTPVACEFPIPTPEEGEIDPDTIEIDYFANGQPPPIPFSQVVDLAACTDQSFYIADDTVVLCPQACELVQSEPMAQLDVRYGCDVGFDPAG